MEGKNMDCIEENTATESGKGVMISELPALHLLEEKHMLEMIEYIDRRSPVFRTDLYSDISRSSGISGKIDKLEVMGVVRRYDVTGRDVITITEKGREMAAVIRFIVDTIENWEAFA